MFGISFTELMLIAVVALIVVGPRRLPEILGTAGKWIGKLRNITSEMRKQTGIDDILRQEGIQGGINELRSLMRPGIGNIAGFGAAQVAPVTPAAVRRDPYEHGDIDRDREYPTEGCDAYGAIPEDLLEPAEPIAALPPAEVPPALPSAEIAPALPGTAAAPVLPVVEVPPALPASNVEPVEPTQAVPPPAKTDEPAGTSARSTIATDPGPVAVLESPPGDKGAE